MYEKLCFFGILAILAVQGSAKELKPEIVPVRPGGNIVRTVPSDWIFYNLESCSIILPNGTAYEIYPNYNATDPRISFIDTDRYDRKCTVNITDVTVKDSGTWILRDVNNDTAFGGPEREITLLPMVIRLEERVDTFPNGSITVMEGNDVFISILKHVDQPKVCGLLPPQKKNSKSGIKNNWTVDLNADCSLTITNISMDLAGKWNLNATNGVIYYAYIDINVKARPTDNRDISLIIGTKTNLVFGPEESIFCQVTDPKGNKMPSQVGQCTMALPKVTNAHNGLWIAEVGLQGATETVNYTYDVQVYEGDNKRAPPNDQTVVTFVDFEDEQNLKLLCSLIVTKVHSCRMSRSDGRTFILENGIFNGRYSYFGNSLSKDLNNNTIFDCGIKISNPSPEDLISWECTIVHGEENKIIETGGAIDIFMTAENIHPENTTSNIVQTNVDAAIDNSFEMMCSTPAPINYCWFQSPNKTQFISIFPDSDSSDTVQYIGRGFSFGECGIKVKYAKKSDAGKWSCNMGRSNAIDNKININVNVHERVLQALQKNVYLEKYITIGCTTYDNSSVEYCRFVRPDGLGINPLEDMEQTSYMTNINEANLKYGICTLTIKTPSNADLGSWLCAAKRPSNNKEYYDFIMVHNNGWYADNNGVNYSLYWISIVVIIGIAMIIAVLVKYTTMPKLIRFQANRFRSSLIKRPLSESHS